MTPGEAQTCFVARHVVSRSRSLRRMWGPVLPPRVVSRSRSSLSRRVSRLRSSRPMVVVAVVVFAPRGVGPPSPSMRRVCRGRRCGASGRRSSRRVCRGRRCSVSGRRSSRRVCHGRGAAGGVTVAVFTPHGVGPPSPSMRHLCRGRGRGLRTACVAVVAFALRVVARSPFSRRVGCRRCLRCVRHGVAAVVVVPRVVYAAMRGTATCHVRPQEGRQWGGQEGAATCRMWPQERR